MKIILIVCAVVSLLLSATAMAVAWSHNPQCEIHCDGVVNWSHWLMIGGSTYAGAFVVMFGLLSVAKHIYHVAVILGKSPHKDSQP